MIKNKKISELFEFLPKSKRNAKYGKEVGEYPFFASSSVVTKYVDEPDYTKNKLVLGDGGTASINYAEKDFSCSDHCYILKPLDEEVLNCKYVYWYLYSNLRVLEAGFKGIGIKNISKTYIQNVEIPVPSKEEQDNIVTILDKADEIRTKKRLANDKLDEFLKSTFISMFGDPVKNDKDLPIAKVGDLTTLVSSGSTPLGGSSVYQEEGIMFIRSQNVLMNRFDFSDIAHISEEIYNSMARTQVKINDVLLNITGASIGRIHRYMFKDKANVNQHVCIIRPILEKVSPVYIEYCIGNANYQHDILRQNSGATRQAFNFEQIKGFKIPLPNIEEQYKFAEIVEKVEAQKQKNEQVIEQMDNLFSSLSQRAFKGEL